jgi:hypothetical protein
VQAKQAQMRFTIEQVGSYIRGDLHERQTAEETRQFLEALAAEALRHRVARILVSVHSSRALFRAQDSFVVPMFHLLAPLGGHRLALVADTRDVRLAQEYAAVSAVQKGLTVKCFAREDEAIAWLNA